MATFVTRQDITPAVNNAWTDVNVSAYIPAGASGVIIHAVQVGTTAASFGFRKNGSTDNRYRATRSGIWHAQFYIGVDANRILELYVTDYTKISFYLLGYFTDNAFFFDNAIDKSPAAAAWGDMDISANTGADIAKAAIFEIASSATTTVNTGLRCNDSSDARTDLTADHRSPGAIVGVDGAEICEGYRATTETVFWLVGYLKDKVVWNLNAANVSLDSVDTYTDLTALDASAVGGIYECIGAGVYNWAFRANGSSEDYYYAMARHIWIVCPCGVSDHIVEHKISNTGLDTFLCGYLQADSAGFTPKARRGLSPRVGARF